MNKILSTLMGLAFATAFAQKSNLHTLVNPFIGTGGHGHTYPGVSAPFGMIQLSPDSRLDGWDGCGGYHYSDSIIYGFSHTHLSGTGVSDYGDLLIMPFTGENQWESGYYSGEEGYGSGFNHANEKASAGSYSVFLNKNQIGVELAATERCGIHKYTYPKWEKKKVIIDLEHRDKLIDSDLILLNDSTLIGKRLSNAWATEQHFFFTVRFSEKALKTEFRKNKDGKPSKLILEFGHLKEELLVKVGISSVDIDGAKKNLNAEMPLWNFNDYLKETQSKWDNELGKVKISTKNKEQEIIFYSALYHAFLNPNLFSDIDGRYRGTDMEIHQNKSRNQYTVFSLWDTFRATHPLFTITQQERSAEFVQTFLAQYQQGEILPIWELSGNYTGCMIGYHSIPVITDAYVKGIRDFDAELALQAMCNSADQNHLGLDAYKSKGYISSEDESESVSRTLEYAYDDWCIAVLADSLGKDSIADVYYKRGQYYKNVLNKSSRFMQPRFNGGWKTSFRPDEVTFDYTEANSWQYSLFVPQDIEGLTNILGGKDSLEAWLDNLFSASSETSGRKQADITGLIGQYAHGNEPSHHMAYLYNYTNSPWKTQQYVSQIINTLYSNSPDGLSGNEDCGQMSSWFVLSSLGLYSVSPGSNTYSLGTPLFESARIDLENGKQFKVLTKNYSKENIYVQSIELKGKELNRNFIYHEEIMAGGILVFTMGNKPSNLQMKSPATHITKSKILPAPVFEDPSPSFTKKRLITINSNGTENSALRYTKDGTEPTEKSMLYEKPIKLKESATITVKAFEDGISSFPVQARFYETNTNWELKLNSSYANQYSAGGDKTLIDQIRGSDDFRTGAWQGYENQDIEVEIDLKKKRKLNEVTMGFIQDSRSWIWIPSEVSFMVSKNGKDWYTIETIKSTTPLERGEVTIEDIGFKKEIKTRYLKIIAKNMGPCPEWHLGAGNPTWLFADEISIK